MAWSRTYEDAEPQRVNRWLAQNGVCSRREAESLITRGLVSIDGETVEDVGRKILPGQTLTLNDTAQSLLESGLTVMINKPVGIVSAQPERDQIPAVRFLTRENLWGESAVIPDFSNHLAPVGRLDMDSRGLLVLSEDGVVAKAVIGPASELEKEYLVVVAGEITEKKLTTLRYGLQLDGRQLRPAKVSLVGRSIENLGGAKLRFILKEGRNRQIRRMCELVGLDVIDLQRIRIGTLRLGDLPEGRWRPLTVDERAGLLKASVSPAA